VNKTDGRYEEILMVSRIEDDDTMKFKIL